MPKKIRVYELARELGLTNKEALDLCVGLGIGVKSHSSSIEDAQADRVRRKADREGLRREVQPEEPAPSKAAPAVAAPSRPPAGDAAASVAPLSPASLLEPPQEPDVGGAARPETEPDKVAAAAAAVPGGTAAPGGPAPDRPGDHGPRPGQRLVVSRPASELNEAARLAAQRPQAAQPPRATSQPPPQRQAGVPGTARPGAAPGSGAGGPVPGQAPGAEGRETGRRPPAGGRIVPPPPEPPRSLSGRPIPPPPGARRPASPGRSGGGGTPGLRGGAPGQRSTMGPRSTMGSRPVAPGRPGGGTSYGRPGGQGSATGYAPRGAAGGGFGGRPGMGGGPPGAGAPGGLRGGPGGRGRPPQRRPRRRRRNIEELEPIQVTAYVPSNAPVPESEVIVERGSTPQQLGPKVNRSAGDVVRFLLLQGEMVTATQALSDDMIELFAAEIGARVRLVDPGEEQEAALRARYFGDESGEEAPEPANLRPRPPVITVMGHVDHGKTLLLDRIRESNVVAGEAGGITQHIGAYQADWAGHTLTFIDTPGHEAFTAMRARGASVTDVVVLVVAADDGVMPQTAEAINHARAADVPVVVAINKIDREDADPNRVMQQLSEHGLVPESWGGDTITVEISALQSVGIEELLEQLVVLAEVLELRADPEGTAHGVVLEANLDVGRGPVASAIVQRGTLRIGDPIVAGPAWGRVKALINDHGDTVKEAPPSMPVQVLGLSEPPIAGDELRVTEDLAIARAVGGAREQRLRFSSFAQSSGVSATAPGAKLEDLFEQISRGESTTLNVVLRADVQGSLEAVTESLRRLERDEVKIAFVHRAVGGVTESDVDLAAASGATIIGFNVRPDRRARELADRRGVEIRTYEIIYKLIEDIESAMIGMLRPEIEEAVTGDAEVRAIFRVPRVGAVAGCYVLNGVITRGSKVRFLREGVVIWKGAVTSLRRYKEDVREVQAGFECGIGLSDFQDLKEHDVIETYEEREIPRT